MQNINYYIISVCIHPHESPAVSVSGPTVHLSGVDIVNGTPILDIKPYIHEYDTPSMGTGVAASTEHSDVSGMRGDNFNDSSHNTTVQSATWLKDKESCITEVQFTSRAQQQLDRFRHSSDLEYGLTFLKTACEAKKAITDILMADPRSTYRRRVCTDRLYYFTVDNIHVSCWFDEHIAEVVKVQPVSRVAQLNPQLSADGQTVETVRI